MNQAAVHRRHGSDGLMECRDPAEVPFLWLVEVAQAMESLVPDFVRWEPKPGNTRSGVDGVVDKLLQCEHRDQSGSSIPSAGGGVTDQCVGKRRVSAVGEAERDCCKSSLVKLRIAFGGVIVVAHVVLSHRTGGHGGQRSKGGRPHGEDVDRNDESQWIEWFDVEENLTTSIRYQTFIPPKPSMAQAPMPKT